MLRTAIISTRIAHRPLVLAASRVQAQRSFASAPRRLAPALKADDIGKGSEGVHPKDELASSALSHPKDAPSKTSPKTTSDDVKLPHMTGDWVLFHPVYTSEETAAVKVLNRDPKNISDRVAGLCVRALRLGFDIFSGYRHKEIPKNHTMTLEQLRKEGYVMDPEKWLLRIVFLETVAGVPGFVAATLRHLRSLRLMRRDAGWIHTLLEESENERMHLMTFMSLKKPSIWFRALVLGAQGVFYNAFFIGYLLSPRTAHRFVGGLEEEAVLTYTRLIDDMENGRLPEWENMPAPSIAIDYWRLPKDAKMIDVIRVVRADEATHRFVNHSLANLNQTQDVNPFAIREPDMILKGTKIGLERAEAAEFVKETRTILEGDVKGEEKASTASTLEKPAL